MESLGHVILYVRDLDVSAAFYRDVVGLAFKLRDARYAEFVSGETRFGLLERKRASDLIHREPIDGGPAGEVLFLVDELDAEAERLRGLRPVPPSGPVDRARGHRTLHVLDPDTFVVELAQRIPRSCLAMADADDRAMILAYHEATKHSPVSVRARAHRGYPRSGTCG
jgi:lactoylglutathione lyase